MPCRLRWGIAGTGKIAFDFVCALQHLGEEKHTIIAVADITQELAEKFALQFNIPKYHDNFEALWQENDVDVLYVGVIHPAHFTIAKLALSAGKAVLCEKPLCWKLTQTQELIQHARKLNKFLMEGMWARHFPVYHELQRKLEAKEVGHVKHAYASFGVPISSVPRIRTKALGGGVVLELGIYCIQFILLAMGGDGPEKIEAQGILNDEGVEVEAAVTMKFSGGRLGSFNVSGSCCLPNEAFVTGTEGTCKISAPFYCPTKMVSPSGSFECPLDSSTKQYNYMNSHGLKYEAEEVARCLRNGLTESPTMPLSTSLLLGELLQTIRENLGVRC